MKRGDLVRHLRAHGCQLVREGARQDKRSAIPRHTEIDDHLANKICKDLGVPFVK
jgi:mRNA interferase HicA